MEIDSYQHGVPCWIDVGVDDVARTADFFTQLWGWDCPEGPAEFGGYRSCTLKGRPVAGIGVRQNLDVPPFWSAYTKVDAIEPVVELVTANGGTVVVPPMEIPGAGRMAVVLDPAGAAFSVWEPGEHQGCGIVNEPGAFSWSELMTDDLEGAKAFYPAVFGWEHETNDGYTEWKVGGRSIAGMMGRPPGMPAEAPPMWTIYFAVDDCDAAVARIQELGGQLYNGPMDIAPGRFAVVAEPSGAMFQVIKLTEGIGG